MNEKASLELARLKKDLADLKSLVETFPEGRLQIIRDKGRPKFYQYFGKGEDDHYHSNYINRSQYVLAVRLWEKAYLTALIEEKEKRFRNLGGYLTREEKISKGQYLKCFSEEEVKALVDDGMAHLATLDAARFMRRTDMKALNAWQNDYYVRNPNYQDELSMKGAYGVMVRSKSEVQISLALAKYQIPFRYECQFMNYEIYPDFTILRPEDESLVIWEHFGLWDKEAYRRNAYSKLEIYAECGYYPDRNLILTYETRDKPFVFADAEEIIEKFFT